MSDTTQLRFSARVLNGLEKFLAMSDVSFGELARQSGIDTDAINDPDAEVVFAALLDLFERAARATGDELFGLHFARANPLGPIGLFHFILMNAPTVGDALAARSRFARLATNAYYSTFSSDDWHGVYTWEFPIQSGARTQFTNYIVTLLVERIRYMMARQDWTPTRVEFDHRAPLRIDEVRRCLGPNVNFNCAKPLLVVDKASLSSPVRSADATLKRELEAIAEKTLATSADDFQTQITKQIVAAMPSRKFTLTEIASSLGVDARTVRRQLRAKGKTFSGLVDETRRDMAERLLTETDLALTEIAFALGFSELSAFSRASKVWFEMTPSQFRKMAAQRR